MGVEKEPQPATFIISRTDAIGDVVLTLPVAAALRSHYPSARILFLGRSYTEEVIKACEHVDAFINWDHLKELPAHEAAKALADTGANVFLHVLPDPAIAKLAKKAGIKKRIGTTNRLYHWWTCNQLVKLSRRRSDLHEAQLNLRLLQPLGITKLYTLAEIAGMYGLTRLPPLPEPIVALLDKNRFNLILHPKSRGNGREWGLENFKQLAKILPADRFKLFVSGTPADTSALGPLLEDPVVTDLTGKLTLPQFITFISKADGLVASGTGPLHLAAALGIHALGLFPPIRPIHPGRWAPIGPEATFFVEKKDCEACRKTLDCTCMKDIRPQQLEEYLLHLPI
jgi:ADP-heptose:LPS heptosyltransferase